MIFWDTSAIVPLLLAEPHSESARANLEGDGNVVAWWLTPIECLSAIARREREGALAPSDGDEARLVLEALRRDWNEVAPSETVRNRAGALLLRHPLRAADAGQLGAALTWAGGEPRDHRLLTLDERMAEAARKEGFRVGGLS